MAKQIGYTYPLDQHREIRPGVMYKESDAPGDMARIYVPPEHPERTAKGDIGLVVIKDMEPKALSHPGVPYVLSDKSSAPSKTQSIASGASMPFKAGLPNTVKR